MTCEHVCKESHGEHYRLDENTEELNGWHQRHWHLQPCRNFRPEDFSPVVSVSRDVGDKERAEGKECRHCNVTRDVTSTRWERHDTHEVCKEDEEEASKQIRCILVRLLSEHRLHNVVIDRHDKHVHQSCETLRSRIADLVLLAPACRNEDAEQEHNGIDENNANLLRYRDVEADRL